MHDHLRCGLPARGRGIVSKHREQPKPGRPIESVAQVKNLNALTSPRSRRGRPAAAAARQGLSPYNGCRRRPRQIRRRLPMTSTGQGRQVDMWRCSHD